MSKVDVKELLNQGVVTVFGTNRDAGMGESCTVVALGAPRGGTSMIAGSVSLLGISMGDRLTAGTFEDSTMINAVASQNADRITKLIAKRNLAHAKWGWKQPANVDYFFESVLPLLRNPVLVVVYRDVLSIGNRNRISAGLDILNNMMGSLHLYQSLTRWILQKRIPAILVSYEKALQHPDLFVNELARYLRIDDPGAISKAVDFITPSPESYLTNSFLLHTKGHLDAANAQVCIGWASYVKQPGRVPEVEILVNEMPAHLVEARLARPDVKAGGHHPTGLCGFRFQWPEGLAPKTGDRVAARVKGDARFLHGSPRKIGG